MSAAPAKVAEGAILGMGNPLLDISAAADQALLDKYGVQVNNAVLAEEKHMPVYAELSAAKDVLYTAGGATQNSIRVAQWMLGEANAGATAFSGSVGDDDYAKQLREAVAADGVSAHYSVDPAEETGKCACLIVKHERSLIAHLGAANHFKAEFMEREDSKAMLGRAQIVYISGFFLTVSPETIMGVARHAHENGKLFAMNLAAPFISQFFDGPLMEAMPYVDLLIGNEGEAEAFAEKQGYEDKSLPAIAERIAALPKANGDRPRTVILTHGAEPTCVHVAGKTEHHDVPAVPEDELVDLNGAGDAFVGGLLSQLVRGADIKRAVEAGHYAAGVIVRTGGIVLAGKPKFE